MYYVDSTKEFSYSFFKNSDGKIEITIEPISGGQIILSSDNVQFHTLSCMKIIEHLINQLTKEQQCNCSEV